MKFTVVFVALLSISAPWLVMGKKVDDPKDKREAPVSNYGSAGHSSSSYQPSQTYQPTHAYQSAQSYQPAQVYQAAQNYEPSSASHGDANAISVGAGYSIGGAKPSYSFGGQGGIATLQIPSDGLQSSGHNTIQLPPITLQPHGAGLVGTDLSQLMSQLSQSINSGALSLQPSNNIAEYHSGAAGAHGAQGAQEVAVPQYNYPNLQQYSLGGSLGGASYSAGAPAYASAAPSYAAGSPIYATGAKGLSTYGSTGPVLFNPSEGQSGVSGLSYATQGSGHSLGDAGAHSLGGSGHGLSGFTLGGAGHSFGGSFKSLGAPSKSQFTPSVFLGASSDSSHGLAGLYNAPSFESLSGGHGLSLSSGAQGPSYAGSFSGFGGDSTKFAAPSFGSLKAGGYGSLDAAGAFSGNGHLSASSGANYGFPTSSYSGGASHAASAAKPYYVSTSKHPSGGSSSFRGPSSSHSSLNSHSSGPKYSFGGSSSSRYSPKDAYGAHSETSYNTIKYSEELKPRNH